MNKPKEILNKSSHRQKPVPSLLKWGKKAIREADASKILDSGFRRNDEMRLIQCFPKYMKDASTNRTSTSSVRTVVCQPERYPFVLSLSKHERITFRCASKKAPFPYPSKEARP